eukprot:GGOE01020576.1.p1 GENE.GGOE01020576.1~~GGOE01020576.1.p1  ORF type:complete len:488 (-),score=153.93 GGOE01020576.1:100-1563(-)
MAEDATAAVDVREMRQQLIDEMEAAPSSAAVPSPSGHNCLGRVRQCVRREFLLCLTFCGVVAGLALGLLLRLMEPSATAIQLLGLPGALFLRSLKMLVLPLVAGSIVGGVCSLRTAGSNITAVAQRTFLYYFLTTTLAVVLGIVAVSIFQPGDGARLGELGLCGGDRVTSAVHTVENRTTTQALVGVVLELVPPNIVEAAATMNVLGVLFFSLFFGVSLSRLGPEAEPFIRGVNVFNSTIAAMVNAILLVSPIGIASLIIEQIVSSCDVSRTWQALACFILTVLVGLVVHCFLVLPGIFFLVTRHNPFKVFLGFMPAVMTAFGTSSSSATLPVTIKCAEETLGVDPNLAQFMLPLGATVNMDGTALYEAVAAIFIAQAHDVPLTFGGTCIVAIVSTLAAVGAAAIPSAGLVTLIMVMQAAGLGEYTSSIAVILVVDWFLDRFRTCVNVLGDSFGVVMLQHLATAGRKRGRAPCQPPGTEELPNNAAV